MIVSLLGQTQQCQEPLEDRTGTAKITNSSPNNLLRRSNIPASHCFAISPTTFTLISSVSLDAHCLSIGFHLQLLASIDEISSFKSHCGRLQALDGGISSLNAIVIRPSSSPARSVSSSNSMTLVSNDPSWWPLINANIIGSYFIVVGCAGIIYDWVLTFAQEVELIWRQRWSLMTFLYLSVRYIGIGYVVMYILWSVPTISMTDAVSRITYTALDWTGDVVNAILGVIMITRLHAMYQQSRKVLIFLVVIFVTIRIANAVMAAITVMHISAEEAVLSGTYQCMIGYAGDGLLLGSTTWILTTAWEVIALCLAVWIAVKHFRELRRHSTRGIIGDCFTVLMQSHVSYFASFLAASCFQIGSFSPTLSADPYSLKVQIYLGFAQIFQFAQMFVLGPRLILGVREYHAKLVADSDAASAMTSIAFQERVHVETSSSV
ncbi:hypothetical protein EV702DRAFT_784574 [Suillus placidus]|uniref:DUF6533 domain-containing protein n=1 Tax=Suillus placidus TaxID=48579 RepID=A0A9P7CWI7_9AGAM|nr:hypothetical protein EV702DRAFT_784574 [Suillus placidus]